MYPRLVNLVRLIWILLVAWYELGTFYHYASTCSWPDQSFEIPEKLPTHVLIVADPQILDSRSYPDRPAWLTRLSQFIVDLNLRKSWRAVRRQRPDAVVFLGDMMDNGRVDMSDSEYEAYVRRFRSIFAVDKSLPMHFLPGNHDIGLGLQSKKHQFSKHAIERYMSHFGPLNQRITLANHTVWMIDAPGLVDEDRERVNSRMHFAQWAEVRPDRTIAYVQSFTQGQHGGDRSQPILFTHVPLSRPEGSDCGPLREHGTLRQGRGIGYQNLLLPEASQFLLDSIWPAVIFSGDDHDYCEYLHTTNNKRLPVPEVTVKSFSMAMGVRKPGYQLLSLISPEMPQVGPTFNHKACLLPDQLGIYLSVYIPLVLLTLVALLVSNYQRVSAPVPSQPSISIFNADGVDGADDNANENYDLPPPSAWRTKEFPKPAWTRDWSFSFALGGRLRRVTLSPSVVTNAVAAFLWTGDSSEPASKRTGVLKGFLKDFWEAAWAPLALFVGIAWWVW